MSELNKADAAQRWYNQNSNRDLEAIESVIFGYIHHAYWDVQRKSAYDALKELQAQKRRIAQLEAALKPFAYECPFILDEATVPKAGIASAPDQVVVNMSVAWTRIEKARAALAAGNDAEGSEGA